MAAGLSFKFTIERNALPTILLSVQREMAQVVRQTAFDVLADAQEAIQAGEKSGRSYRGKATTRAGGKRNTSLLGGLGLNRVGGEEGGRFITGYGFHRASAPGEAPATDIGHLVNNSRVQVSRNGLSADVVFGAEYAAALEFGTVDEHIAARPFLTPAMKAHEEKFASDCAAALARGMAEGSR